ncbi:HalOD1 output domain-containing protein [Natrinema longum]|uniref:HalOD1 output domain-containing protein n=1 Tax=Natrinema longum TaxID=370324 RepID=UPI001CCB62FF|nr:HalOD1 output domain-containing protein [Natrinema longum]MBZ6496775.1 hypothetical protein [Natrinema longum]
MPEDSRWCRPTDGSTDSVVVSKTTWDRDSGNTPVNAVVSAVATATGIDSLELPPLYETIDPDALNALFLSGPGDPGTRTRFRYAGYGVTVQGDGTVRVQPGPDV